MNVCCRGVCCASAVCGCTLRRFGVCRSVSFVSICGLADSCDCADYALFWLLWVGCRLWACVAGYFDRGGRVATGNAVARYRTLFACKKHKHECGLLPSAKQFSL